MQTYTGSLNKQSLPPLPWCKQDLLNIFAFGTNKGFNSVLVLIFFLLNRLSREEGCPLLGASFIRDTLYFFL